METITTIQEENKQLPWFCRIDKEQQKNIRYIKSKGIEKVLIQDIAPIALNNIAELIINSDTPPQVRLQSCQLVLNKVIGDRIEIMQSKVSIDVNKLLDQLSGLHHATMQPIDITEDSNEG